MVAQMSDEPDVSEGRAFYAPGLKVDGRIFAMLVDYQLVVKLPARDARILSIAGRHDRFPPGGAR